MEQIQEKIKNKLTEKLDFDEYSDDIDSENKNNFLKKIENLIKNDELKFELEYFPKPGAFFNEFNLIL